jgi:hypothetical protein
MHKKFFSEFSMKANIEKNCEKESGKLAKKSWHGLQPFV